MLKVGTHVAKLVYSPVTQILSIYIDGGSTPIVTAMISAADLVLPTDGIRTMPLESTRRLVLRFSSDCELPALDACAQRQ